ncbi:MAG: hypothetical protein HY925_06755 [Elusimicrobia bacterium]|nr:hypothetical protein [Elusimicrobiota bacterium]
MPKTLLLAALLFAQALPAAAQCSRSAAAGLRPSSGNLEGVKVRPNPWRSDKNSGQTLKFGSSVGLQWVMVFNASGKWVRTLYCRCQETEKEWDLTNDVGQPVKSGIYVYLIRDVTGRQSRGTLAVLR